MKKRLLALFLTAAMIVAASATCVSAAVANVGTLIGETRTPSYDKISICGMQIDPEYCDDIFGYYQGGLRYPPFEFYADGFASYDFYTHTLTLKDAYIYYDLAEYAAIMGGMSANEYDPFDYTYGIFGAIESHLEPGQTLTIKLYGENVIEADNCAIFATNDIVFDFAEGATLNAYGGIWSYNAQEMMEFGKKLYGLETMYMGGDGDFIDPLVDADADPVLTDPEDVYGLSDVEFYAWEKYYEEYNRVYSIVYAIISYLDFIGESLDVEEDAEFTTMTYFIELYHTWDSGNIHTDFEVAKFLMLQHYGLEYIIDQMEEAHYQEKLADDLYGNITVKGGTLNIMSCPDFYALPLYLGTMLDGFWAADYDPEFVYYSSIGTPLFDDLMFVYDQINWMASNYPISVIVADDFTVEDSVVNVEACDDFYSRGVEYDAPFMNATHFWSMAKTVNAFFFGWPDGEPGSKKLIEPLEVCPVKIMGDLNLDNGLFWLAQYDGGMMTSSANKEFKPSNPLYVGGKINSNGLYDMEGCAKPVSLVDRMYEGYFYPAHFENGYCVVEGDRTPEFTSVVNAVVDKITSALPFLSGRLGRTPSSVPGTIYIVSEDCCISRKFTNEPKSNGIYYAGIDLPYSRCSTPLYFEKAEGYENGWYIFSADSYYEYVNDGVGPDIPPYGLYDNTCAGISEGPLAVGWTGEGIELGFYFDYDTFEEEPNTLWRWDKSKGTMAIDVYRNGDDFVGTYYLSLAPYRPGSVNEVEWTDDPYNGTTYETDFFYGLDVTSTPTKISFFKDEINPKGHNYVVEENPDPDPSDYAPDTKDHHILRCTECGMEKKEVCTFDPETGKCVCGNVDPKFLEIQSKDIKVSTQKTKLPGTNLFVISVTIKVDHDPKFPVFVEYMLPGSEVWMPYVIPFSLAPNQYLTMLPIRVTDMNHNQYYFMWEEGYGVYPMEMS